MRLSPPPLPSPPSGDLHFTRTGQGRTRWARRGPGTQFPARREGPGPARPAQVYQKRGRDPAAFKRRSFSFFRSCVLPIFILGTHFSSLMVCNAPGERQRVCDTVEEEEEEEESRPRSDRRGEGVPCPEPRSQKRAVAHCTSCSHRAALARRARVRHGNRKAQIPESSDSGLIFGGRKKDMLCVPCARALSLPSVFKTECIKSF